MAPAMSRRTIQTPPSFVNGRKGRASVVDSIIVALWKRNSDGREWPELSFTELTAKVADLQGYPVSGSTIRSSIYQHSDLFERIVPDSSTVHWKLSDHARHAGKS